MGSNTKQYAVVNGQLEVTKTEENVSVAQYDYKALVQQKENIIAQRDRDNLHRDEEIAYVDELIAAAKGLNLEVAAEVTPVAVLNLKSGSTV